LNYTRV